MLAGVVKLPTFLLLLAAVALLGAADGDAAASTAAGGKWAQAIIEWGPWAIFAAFVISGVGLHITEDFILIPAGYIAFEHHDGMGWFIRSGIAAYLGIVLGDALWLYVCRNWAAQLLHTKWFKRMIHPRRLLEVKHQIDERGAWVLVAARFVPGTRTPVLTMSGLLHMPWWKFFAAELPTTAITVPLQMLIGVGVAKMGEGVHDTAHKVIIMVAAAVVLLGLSVWLHAYLSARRKRQKTPRSPAKWLRVFRRRSPATVR